jgi:hypothetical protein
MWLTEKQVQDLTKAKQVQKQVAVLTRDGVPFKMVAGRPIVMESALAPVAESTARPKVRKLP